MDCSSVTHVAQLHAGLPYPWAFYIAGIIWFGAHIGRAFAVLALTLALTYGLALTLALTSDGKLHQMTLHQHHVYAPVHIWIRGVVFSTFRAALAFAHRTVVLDNDETSLWWISLDGSVAWCIPRCTTLQYQNFTAVAGRLISNITFSVPSCLKVFAAMDCSLFRPSCARQLQLCLHCSELSTSVSNGHVSIQKVNFEASIPMEGASCHTTWYYYSFLPDCIDAWDFGTSVVVNRQLARHGQSCLTALSDATQRFAVCNGCLRSTAVSVSRLPHDEPKDLTDIYLDHMAGYHGCNLQILSNWSRVFIQDCVRQVKSLCLLLIMHQP